MTKWESRQVALPDELDRVMTEDEVNYPDEKISEWIRGAIYLRMNLVNDDDAVRDAKEQLAETFDCIDLGE